MKLFYLFIFSIFFSLNADAKIPFSTNENIFETHIEKIEYTNTNKLSSNSNCLSASIHGSKECVVRFNIYLDDPNDIDDIDIAIVDEDGNDIPLEVYSEGADDEQFMVITFPENGMYSVTFSLLSCDDVIIDVEITTCFPDCFDLAFFKEKGCTAWFYLSLLSGGNFKFDVTLIDTETGVEITFFNWEVDDIFTDPLLQIDFPYNGTFEITLSSLGCADYTFEYTATTCPCEVSISECASISECYHCYEYNFNASEVTCVEWTATSLSSGVVYTESDVESFLLSGNLFDFGDIVEVCVHVCGGAGCEDTECTTLNWCGGNFSDETISSNRGANQNLSMIYPNPIKGDLLTIEMDELDELNGVKIYDTHGKLLIESLVEDGNIDISTLSNGLYFVIIDNGKSLETHRLIRL